MDRTPLIAGNWKMHMSIAEARELAGEVAAASKDLSGREVMIAPPFTALAAVGEVLKGSKVRLAAQNVCWEERGAFTGEVSPLMLRDVGCSMVIVGHSERRQLFGESDAMINRRLRAALAHKLVPILCFGEMLAERDGGRTFAVLEKQIREGLVDVATSDPGALVLAYEPVWAIGTGKTASVEQAQEAHAFVRQLLSQLFEKNIASQLRILYGGSVNSENVDALMRQADVDGALVGGAALKAASFSRIMHFQ